MKANNVMENAIKNEWMLIVRGVLYVVAGGVILFGGQFDTQSAQLIGGSIIGAGLLGTVFSLLNLKTDRNYSWELIRSLFDIAFGIAFLLYASGDITLFVEAFGFWAMMFSVIEAAQSTYMFMLAGPQKKRNFLGDMLHLLNVVVAATLSYLLTLTSVRTGLIGLLPAALGVSIILIVLQQKRLARMTERADRMESGY